MTNVIIQLGLFVFTGLAWLKTGEDFSFSLWGFGFVGGIFLASLIRYIFLTK